MRFPENCPLRSLEYGAAEFPNRCSLLFWFSKEDC